VHLISWPYHCVSSLPSCSQTSSSPAYFITLQHTSPKYSPDLWSVLWETLLCMGSTISFHQMTYCSISLVLQPQLSSRYVTLKCFLGIYSFYSTIMLIISICSSLVHCIMWTMVSIFLHPKTTCFSQWPSLYVIFVPYSHV